MSMTTIQRFGGLLSQYRSEIRQIYTYAIFSGIVNLTLPLGIQAIINYIHLGEVTSSWIILVGFVLLGITVTGFLQILQLRIVENMQQDLFARSAFEFAFRLPQITFLQLDKIHAPELVNRFFDTLSIQKGLPKILIDFSLAAFQIIFGLILLAFYSPYFIVFGVVLILVLWLIFQFTGRLGLKTSLQESKYKYALVHWLEEVARLNRSFKLNNGSKFHLHRTDDITVNYLAAREKHFQVLLNQFRLFVGFKVLIAAGLLLLGGLLVFNQQMDIGQFVAAEIIIILIINSVEKILRVFETIYDVLTAVEKIGYVTDLKLDQNDGTAILESTAALSINAQEIKFKFPDATNEVIENLSFDIPANSKVIINGKTGSGKTILLQILAGIHQINEGAISINGIPFNNYQKESLYGHIGVALPVNQLFEGSLKDNITLGRDIADQAVEDVIELLGLKDFLSLQPKRLQTLLDTGGRRLPRGIIQKILIARIIVGNPKLLLLEDPLQFVEEEEKRRIIDYLMSPKRNWTVVVVADYHYWNNQATQILNL